MAPIAVQLGVVALGTAATLLLVRWRQVRKLKKYERPKLPRRVGLIGGLAPASTIDYYKAINEGVRENLGGRHAGEVVIFSLDQAPVIEDEHSRRWDAVGTHLARAGCALQAAGCECLLVCCNTVHHETAFAALTRAVRVPVIHIAEVTADALAGKRRVALLGTEFTAAEGSFFVERLQARGFEVVLDEPEARATLDRIIYEELILDIVSDEAVRWFAARVERLLGDERCEACVLGCTELSMLTTHIPAPTSCVPAETSARMPISQKYKGVLLDTAELHAEAAVRFAVGVG